MNLFEFFVLVLATFCLSVVAFFVFTFLFPLRPTVVVMTESDAPARWWPWSVTSYNHWPYWMGGGSGGSGIYYEKKGDEYERKGGHEGRGHEGRGLEGRGGGHTSRPWGGGQRGAEGGAPKH